MKDLKKAASSNIYSIEYDVDCGQWSVYNDNHNNDEQGS